jgi:hypothetical protein
MDSTTSNIIVATLSALMFITGMVTSKWHEDGTNKVLYVTIIAFFCIAFYMALHT